MSRKAEIQATETAVASPLRRSTRRTSVNSPAPATLTSKPHTRLQLQNENEETKLSKNGRGTSSQENTEKENSVESKPATRGRRASTSKEEPDKKPEPAKTRSRRSSAASESSKEEEVKPQTVTRRRRSSATEEISSLETVKPVRTRRASATEKTEEEPKKTTRARRNSVKEEETKEEPVKRNTRSRRSSVDKTEEVEVKDKKTVAKGKKSAPAEPNNEPEPKAVTLTPVKPRRRLSVTENAVNLEPIEELESEIKSRNSNSPVIKDGVVNLTPVNSDKGEVKGNLNLSIIKESSFTEETDLDDSKKDRDLTPRRSPRLSKSNSSSPKSGKEQVMDTDQSPEQGKTESKEESKPSTSVKLELNEEDLESDLNVKDGIETVKEEQPYKNEEIAEVVEQKLLEEVENSNLSIGSDGSFKFHLNMSIPTSQDESVQEKDDDLNSSKSSNMSDKENVDTNKPSGSAKKLTEEEKQPIVDDLTKTHKMDKSLVLEEVVVARVSNVFRPKMKENSFMEPMEVDEDYSMLEQETPGKSPTTPITDESFKDVVIQGAINKNLLKDSVTDKDNDLVDESFYLHLSVGPEDKNEETRDISNQEETKIDENSKEAHETTSNDEQSANETEPSVVKSPVEICKSSPSPKHVEEISKSPINITRRSKSPTVTIEGPTSSEVQKKSKSPIPQEESPASSRKSQSPIAIREKSKSSITTIDDTRDRKISKRESKSPVSIEEKCDRLNLIEKQEVCRKSKTPPPIEETSGQLNLIEKQELRRKSKSPVPIEKPVSVKTNLEKKEKAEVQRNSKSPVPAKEESISTQASVDHSDTAGKIEVPKKTENAKEAEEVAIPIQAVVNSLDKEKEIEVSAKSKSADPKNDATENSCSEKNCIKPENSSTNNLENTLKEEYKLTESKNSDFMCDIDTTISPETQNLRIRDIEREVRRRSRSPQPHDSKVEKPEESVENLSKESDQPEKTEGSATAIDSDKTVERETEQLKKLERLSEKVDAKALVSSENEDVSDLPRESIKSGPSDDYDFEIPSDEEETHKMTNPVCDQSTVVNSFMASSEHVADASDDCDQTTVVTSLLATSQHISDSSGSVELETVIFAKKKIIEKFEQSQEEENLPDEKLNKNSCQVQEDDVFEEDTEKTADISEANKSSSKKSENNDEMFDDDQEELVNAEADESVKEVLEVEESSRKSRDSSKDRTLETSSRNKSEIDVDEDYSEDEITASSKKKIEMEENRVSEESIRDTKEKIYSVSSTDSSSPRKIITPKEELDFYKESIDKVSKKPRKKINTEVAGEIIDSEDQIEENENKNCASSQEDSESPLKKLKTKKKSKKKRILENVTSHKDNVEIEDIVSSDELQLNISQKESPKKKSKSKHRNQKRKYDESPEDVTKPKKLKKSEKKKIKKENLRNLDSNEDSQSQESPVEKSPSSKLDEFLDKKIKEIDSEDESYNEEENPEEPNEYLYTMAEEGEEDTPSEDSNAIIDEGESINSTDTERGDSDDHYDENDSFICDDENEELLSGEEYDLSYEKKDKKKPRLIQLDKIIKAKKKENSTPTEKKRSRIITLSDSSESDGEFKPTEDNNEEEIKYSEESSEVEEVVQTPEKTDIKEPKASPSASPSGTEPRKRLASIIIHENINVKEIEDSNITERISHLVDSFCTTMRKDEISEISMNVSIECTGKGEKISLDESLTQRSKEMKESSFSESISDNESTYQKPKNRLSVSLCEPKKKAKKRKNKSSDEMESEGKKKKKQKKTEEKKKTFKKRYSSEEELMKQSFGLINRLISDVRNRPRRTIKPSTIMETSWLTEEVGTDVKPSTSAFDKQEKEAYKAGKVHPKDFRSQMLNDPTRIKRIDTKKLLKKKGVYL